ncbi:hypothetical protein CAEBREN_08947 [Caenorhabditis brenneri]|uniref:Uncharacterized protein n=1 Tax=Caenorhabditis brenneri TaxID=135651 RepID=G0PEB6_CAEBE|nr:hypothetical protein CAEBREN_08947 [Caenorhabditis brenneri]
MGDESAGILTKKEKPEEVIVSFCPVNGKFQCFLFKQPGFLPNHEQRFKMHSYTWSIMPYKYERDGKLGVDIIINVYGVTPGTFLLTEFTLHQPGAEKQRFEHVFDYNRNSFIYRRALTIPKDCDLASSYSHFRFLRDREDDEPNDGEEAKNWKRELPPEWIYDGEHYSPKTDHSQFLNDLYVMEDCKMSFVYYFTVEAVQKMTFRPPQKAIVWPKASITARYLNGRSIAVDGSWFSNWPGFKKFMHNVDLLSPEDFDDFMDILGVYYHSWSISHHKIQDLVRVAEKFGFYDFPQSQLMVGNVDVYFSSMRSVIFASPSHPLLKNTHRASDQIISKFGHSENFSFSLRHIWHDDYSGPPVFKCYKTQNGMAWSVNIHRKTFSKKEYLCVSLMLNGPYKEDENQLWRVEFLPAKHSSIGKLPKREHTRVLNTVQRTICFPTCWLWADVVKEMGRNGPFNFSLKTQFNTLTGWRWDAVAGNIPATGVTNGHLQVGKHNYAINLDMIQELCGKLRDEWVPMNGKQNCMELDLDPSDVMHFLDHLYHSSKFYTVDKWKRILKVAQATHCDPVVDQFERALLRTEAQKVRDKTFNDNYSLDYLRFNIEMRDQFQLQTLDDFLRSHPDPIMKMFDNDNCYS